MAVRNKSEFESKYGAPPNGLQNIAIGMKGGKAVYGTEMESKDTKGEGVINNTWSQNQAIMDSMFKEMGRSGGMYNPSASDIRRAEQLSPPTAADYKVTTRADGKQMVGAYSPEAAAMRESSSGPDAQYLQKLKPQPYGPPKELMNPQPYGPPKELMDQPTMPTSRASVIIAAAPPAALQGTPPTPAEGTPTTPTTPATPPPPAGPDNAAVLKGVRDKNNKGNKGNKGVDEEDLDEAYVSKLKTRFDPMTGALMA
jgi:hypothetical protein